MSETVNLTIDGVPVTVPKGTLLVEAAKIIKQQIPIYCYHTKLGPAGLCRICMVEIEGMPKLQIACNTVATDGMVVRTQGEKVDAARAVVLELFLVNHPLDCPICDKGGECDLQDYAMAYARGTSDVADPKLAKPKAVDLGPTIVLDEERCIVCQRCVRFDDIIADERQLVVKDRGAHDIIATATGVPYRHNFTGNVTELCPVGALTSKTYRFKSRPWDLERTQTTCTQCAVGCQQFADVRYGTLLRTMLVEEDEISDGWLCDRGRYNVGFYESPDRITQPLYRKDGGFVQIGWDDAFILWAKAIRDAIAARGTGSRRRDRRRTADQRRSLRPAASFPHGRRREPRLARRGATPGHAGHERRAARRDRSRAGDRHRRRLSGGARAGALAARPQSGASQRREDRARFNRARGTKRRRRRVTGCADLGRRGSGTGTQLRRSICRHWRALDLYRERAGERARRRSDGHAAIGRFDRARRRARRKICGAFDLRCESGAQRPGFDDHRCRARSYSVLGRERALPHRNGAARDARAAREGRVRKDRDHAQRGRRACCRSTRRWKRPTSCSPTKRCCAGSPISSMSRSHREKPFMRSSSIAPPTPHRTLPSATSASAFEEPRSAVTVCPRHRSSPAVERGSTTRG